MQSGVISSENVADVLRGISQRRRQGVLEINAHEEILLIKFVQGRVVEASSSGMSGVQETVAWLNRAGYPCRAPDQYNDKTYANLLQTLGRELPNPQLVSAEMLARVVRHRVLDRLYSMEVGAGAFYTFKVQMVDYERDFAPSISIGQVLLDLVELNAEKDDFDAKFPPGAVLRLTGNRPSGLGEEESCIVSIIGQGMEVRELERRALLSAYHFRHAVLELTAASIITLGGPGDVSTNGDASIELDSFLSSSIDAAFGIEEPADDVPPQVSGHGLSDLVEDIDDASYEGDPVRPNYIAVSSARLLQNVWVPSLIAFGFLILAMLSPFLAWSAVVAMFADM